MQISLLAFEGFEELDLVGPWEVLRMAATLNSGGWECRVVAKSLEPVQAAKGLRILPDVTLADAPLADVLVVPGGRGTRVLADDPELLAFIATQAKTARWSFSICTGALLMFTSGVSVGKRVTTHWAHVDELRRLAGDKLEVLSSVRFVRDGNLLSASGVSAGIDAALWLVGELTTPEFARKVQRAIEYEPAPPYTAEV